MTNRRPLPPRLVLVPALGVGLALLGAAAGGGPRVDSGGTTRPVATPVTDAAPGATAKPIVFGRDIRPLLSDRCFGCHGPDPAKRAANLRLDLPEAATGPLPNHKDQRAIVPGHPEQSVFIQRITSKDPGRVMPPPTSHLSLNDDEKALLTRWIAEGAHYEPHFAFNALTKPAAPAVRDAAWARSDIDRFVLARLEEQGLKPNPEAGKAALLRRLSLDLTGLPPTPQELDTFLADTRPDAYERQVDRLLASPRYGEHLAAWWLDLARYADSHGFQSDPERYMWLWRDGVINAFNRNQPFDQFTIEQLAGDLLPNATKQQIIATGFNRNHRINSEGGAIDEEWRLENVLDRSETTSAVWLGLTMNCARCHDHKYDPITQKDYYRFAAFFNNVDERGVDDSINGGGNTRPIERLGTPEQMAAADEAEKAVSEAEKVATEARKVEHDPEVDAWIAAGATLPTEPAPAVSVPLSGDLTSPTAGVQVTQRGGGTLVWTARDGGKALVIKDRNPGVAITGLPALDGHLHLSFTLRREGSQSKENAGPLLTWQGGQGRQLDLTLSKDGKFTVTLSADGAQREWSIDMEPLTDKAWTVTSIGWTGTTDEEALTVWTDGWMRRMTPRNGDPAKRAAPKAEAVAPVLLLGADGKRDAAGAAIAGLGVWTSRFDDAAGAAQGVRAQVAALMAKPAAKRTGADRQALERAWGLVFTTLRRQELILDNLRRTRDRLNRELPSVMVMRENKQRVMHLLERGQYDHPKEEVTAGTPGFLPPLPPASKDAPANRLALAKWLVQGNPLTGRVLANRLWERLFGTGLISTSENLGLQSAWPSHPELLDHLAAGLEDGWDLKAFLRRVVTSATYRQESTARRDALEQDPDNRLLWRSPHLRLGAEAIRDQALAASGLLVEQLGGPSVKPYLPADLWAGNRFGNLAKYEQSAGDQVWRRSLYTFVKRTAPPTNAVLFDMPSREYCTIKRSRTNTPLQALTLQNDPTYLEASRVLGQRMLKEGGATAEARVTWAVRQVLARPATPAEVDVLAKAWTRYRARYATPEGLTAAADLIKQGRSPVDGTLDAADLAASLLVASTILNLDETVTKP